MMFVGQRGKELSQSEVSKVQALVLGAGNLVAALSLSATTTGQRQALGTAQAIGVTCAAGCTLYYRFVDGSAAIGVTTSDAPATLTTAPAVLPVPVGRPYLEYVLASGTATVVVA